MLVSGSDKINWTAIGQERIFCNVSNLLRIRKNEISFMREMGITPDYIDAPLNKVRGALIGDVIDNVGTYEPRATLNSVDVDGIADEDVGIKVVLKL